MSETPKRRRWFQIHLSTAIVVMFVTGILVFLNIRSTNMSEPQRGDFDSEEAYDLAIVDYAFSKVVVCRGRPCVAWETGIGPSTSPKIGGPLQTFEPVSRWLWSGLCIDVALALATVVATVVLSESFIRRRPQQAQGEEDGGTCSE